MPRTFVPSLGYVASASIVLTNIIGLGVFLKGRAMTCEVGSPALVLAAWLAAGTLALCGAFAFAELGAMMPQAGGSYVYLRRAYGEPVAFAFGWMMLFVAAPASIGALGSGAAIFFDRLSSGALQRLDFHANVPGATLTITGTQWASLAFIAVVTLVNCAPVRLNGTIATNFAVLKLTALAGIAIAGLALGRGHPAPAVAATCMGIAANVRGGTAGFAAAMIAALYAYNGWTSLTAVASEVKHPATTLPRALLGAVGLVIVLYVAANAAFLKVLGVAGIEHLPQTASVGVATAQALFGSAGGIVSSAVLFLSAIATLQVAILAYSRYTFAVASDGVLFAQLARLSVRGVPVRAVVATSAIAAGLVLLAGFDRLSDYFVFNTWVFYLIAAIGLFVLRVREPSASRPYRSFGYPVVPAVFVAVAAWMLLQTVLAKPFDSLAGLLVVAAAYPFYVARRRFRPA